MRALIVCVVLLLGTSIAGAQTVSYTVSIPKPTSSLLHVVMEISGATGASLEIAMPAWSPGAYGLHWAAKNVQGLSARDGSGRALDAAMIATTVWRIKPTAPLIRVAYDVYMGAASVNDTHATITGTRSLMYLIGRTPYPAAGPLTVTVDAPPNWKLATGLDAVRPGVFTAPDYDTLVDAPIEASPELEIVTFEHERVAYEIVIHARHNYDTARLRDDVRKIVAEETRLMGGAPYKRYVFFFHGTNGRSGGRDHLNSHSTTVGRQAQ